MRQTRRSASAVRGYSREHECLSQPCSRISRPVASIDQFLEWFQGVERWKVETVLDHELRYLAETVAS